jgi:hypothetical protein
MFRVGRADEPAAIGGITHLVEHLALAPLRQQDYGHNGLVTSTRTVFHANGTDEQLTDYFDQVTRTLGALPLDRVGMERGILLQESQSAGSSAGGTVRWLRFGHRGHGLLGVPEVGLDWLGPDPVADWAARMFTAGNAAMWFSGPPPAGLRLHLPAGARNPPVPLTPIEDLQLPAQAGWGSNGVGLSYLASRSADATSALAIIARRARDTLRFERGRVYDIHADYDPVDATTAHCIIATDCRPDHVTEVARELLAIVDALAADGATPEELEREARNFRDGALRPPGRYGFLDGAAYDRLLDRPREEPMAILAEFDALTPAGIAELVAAARQTLLLVANSDPPTLPGLTAYPAWSTKQVQGREYRPPGLPFAPNARKDRLTIGDEGVMYRTANGQLLTVRYDECVVYRHWEGPIREMWGEDGFRLRIAAAEWRSGQEAIDRVDAAIPPALVACDEHGVGGLEEPPEGFFPG